MINVAHFQIVADSWQIVKSSKPGDFPDREDYWFFLWMKCRWVHHKFYPVMISPRDFACSVMNWIGAQGDREETDHSKFQLASLKPLTIGPLDRFHQKKINLCK